MKDSERPTRNSPEADAQEAEATLAAMRAEAPRLAGESDTAGKSDTAAAGTAVPMRSAFINERETPDTSLPLEQRSTPDTSLPGMEAPEDDASAEDRETVNASELAAVAEQRVAALEASVAPAAAKAVAGTIDFQRNLASNTDTASVASTAPVPRTSAGRGRRLVGLSLWIFGAMLWAYLVTGEYVLRAKLPEVLGWLIVLAALGGSWVLTTRRLPVSHRSTRSTLVPGVLAVGLWLVVLFFAATLLGTGRRSEIAGVTAVLWLSSVVALFAGRRLARLPHGKRSKAARIGAVLVWVLSGLATLVAVASWLDDM